MVQSDDFRTFIDKAKASGGAEMANCQPFIERLCRFMSLPEPDLATERNHQNDYVYERRIAFKHPDGSTSPGRRHCASRSVVALRRWCCLRLATLCRNGAGPSPRPRWPTLA